MVLNERLTCGSRRSLCGAERTANLGFTYGNYERQHFLERFESYRRITTTDVDCASDPLIRIGFVMDRGTTISALFFGTATATMLAFIGTLEDYRRTPALHK